MPASPTATPAPPESRFTRVLFAAAIALGAITLGVRLVRGLRTGDVEWLEMSLPAAAMLMLGAIMAGPRRRWAYYPLLAVSFALLIAFYALPHRVRRDAGSRRPPQRAAAAPAPAPAR
jgi:hypothetical protein